MDAEREARIMALWAEYSPDIAEVSTAAAQLGMATSGVVVATMIASISLVAMPDLRIASSEALKAMFDGRSSSSAQCRCRMPVTWYTYWSEISGKPATSSEFVTTRDGK